MKKINYILAGLALLTISCEKEEINNKQVDEQEVSIYIKDIESGDFTKVSSAVVGDLIESLLPTSGVTFTLSSTSNPDRKYTVNIGESITVPIDAYNVTAYYRPTSVGNTVKNGYIYKNPRFYVETTIVVEKDKKNYVVNAIYECWALVIDYTVCSKYQHLGYNYSMEDFTYFHNSDNNLGIAFIYGSFTTQPYIIKAYPRAESGYEPKTYNLVTDKNYSGILIEYSKWYSFSASSIDDTSGSIIINYPSWTQGGTTE